MTYSSSIGRVAALLLLMAVLVIFVSPAFDIPATTLRAKALAQLITLLVAAIGAIVTGMLCPTPLYAIGHAPRRDDAPECLPPPEASLPLLC